MFIVLRSNENWLNFPGSSHFHQEFEFADWQPDIFFPTQPVDLPLLTSFRYCGLFSRRGGGAVSKFVNSANLYVSQMIFSLCIIIFAIRRQNWMFFLLFVVPEIDRKSARFPVPRIRTTPFSFDEQRLFTCFSSHFFFFAPLIRIFFLIEHQCSLTSSSYYPPSLNKQPRALKCHFFSLHCTHYETSDYFSTLYIDTWLNFMTFHS